MKQLFAVLMSILSVSAVFGQETARPTMVVAEKTVTKVITLKYGNRIGEKDLSLLGGLMLHSVNRSGDLVVVTGTQERVDMAESILQQLDVPPAPPRPAAPKKNIQLTPYLIIASTSGVQGTSLPKDLESAVTQVASVFPYKTFNLFDAIVLRVTEGNGGSVEGILPKSAFPTSGTYSLTVRQVATESAGGMVLNGFSLAVFIANGLDKDGKDKVQTVRLNTNLLEIADGQKVVVGKANIDGGSNALIVILTAKVVD